MMFSWLKYRRSFISRSVRRQNMEWSNGVIFLMATFWPEGLCSAELWRRLELNANGAGSLLSKLTRQLHRLPHQPHPGYRTAPKR